MMMKKRFSAAVAALGAAAMLATATIPVASAAGVVTGKVAEGMVPSTIDADRVVTLTIKKQANASDQSADAVWVTGGVPFTIKRIAGIDITTAKGWDKINSMTLADAKLAPGTSITKKTGANGEAVFTNLKPGVYLVVEKVPADAPDNYRVATPFVTVLPVADGDTKTWRYDVTITPKTEPIGKTKPFPPSVPTPTPTPNPSPKPQPPDSGTFIPFIPIIPVVIFPPGVPPKPQAPRPSASVPAKPVPAPVPNGNQAPPSIPRSPLANTGANVMSIFGIGMLILILGTIIMAARKKNRGV